MASDLPDQLRHAVPDIVLRGARSATLGLLLCAVAFLEQLTEFAAPLLLTCGIGWWALPRLLTLAPADGQAREALNQIMASFPTRLALGGHTVSPPLLIADGLLLMGFAAVLQAAGALITGAIWRDR